MASDEMIQPVTRGEMVEALRDQSETLRGEMREQSETLRAEMREQSETLRAEMREQSETLRGEMREQTSTILRAVEDRFVITEQRWDRRFEGIEQRFVDLELQLVRQVSAIIKTMQDHLKVADEPYRDLPARVTRLEEHVFRPKRQRRR